jgi:hypothetical protein
VIRPIAAALERTCAAAQVVLLMTANAFRNRRFEFPPVYPERQIPAEFLTTKHRRQENSYCVPRSTVYHRSNVRSASSLIATLPTKLSDD